ncbi:LD-carboxypeptidase [Sesbania bispinosa]|nr:LD-carboxypeptidase [Sesbania bispinosa]
MGTTACGCDLTVMARTADAVVLHGGSASSCVEKEMGGDWMKREGNLTPFLVVTAEEKWSSGVPPSTEAQWRSLGGHECFGGAVVVAEEWRDICFGSRDWM